MHPWVGLSDQVRLGVVTRWVTPELVAEVLGRCGVRDKKPGALPAGFMVYYTLALALFQQDSYTPKKIKNFLAILAARYAGNSTTVPGDCARRTGTSSGRTRSTPRSSPTGSTPGTGSRHDASHPRSSPYDQQ
ncbi:transposase domain-containing protein [Streptacidiphilus rugosus]|uniref:transposase domain-containing protein n=1 Tax=Streptacidiphilus rugosus TaxID=405783 RepID=UPI000A03E983